MLKLPDTVSSSQDLSGLILEIRDYAKWYAHEAIKKRVKARHKQEKPELTEAAEETLRQWAAKKPLNRQSLDSLITELEKIKRSSPTMTITLAAPPSGKVKTLLAGWCRKNISDDVLINFEFNSSLLGGLVVRSGSKIHDWSFRRQILEAGPRFPEVLRNV